MMQLIVLGQIPGTHFQLTYAWFQIILLSAILAMVYKAYRTYIHKQSLAATQRHFDVISLRSLDQA
jgi:hypothetical protein